MTITAVSQWDGTTAANNTDLNDIPLDSSTMTPSQVDDAIAEMMKQIKAGIGVSFQAYSANLTSVGTAWTAASSSGPASMAFAEDTDNGTNKVTLKGQASVASDIEVLLPATAGTLYVSGGTDVAVADGGTNISSYTEGDLLYASGATTLSKLAKGTAAQILRMNAGATAPEWADAASTNSYTLLGTLTTTSGTTQSLTDIAAGYREFVCELEGVSLNAAGTLTLALSSTNGAAYGTAATVSNSTAAASGTLNGIIRVVGISSTVAVSKVALPATILGAGTGLYSTADSAPTDTAAVVNAIQFAGGTFDAGTIRIYGVK